MPMLLIEWVKWPSGNDRFSDFWFDTSMGQEFFCTSDWSASRKTWSISVAWIWRPEGMSEERISRETVPAPQALSWIMAFGGMGGRSERLCAANWEVTAPPVASYTSTLRGPSSRAATWLGGCGELEVIMIAFEGFVGVCLDT